MEKQEKEQEIKLALAKKEEEMKQLKENLKKIEKVPVIKETNKEVVPRTLLTDKDIELLNLSIDEDPTSPQDRYNRFFKGSILGKFAEEGKKYVALTPVMIETALKTMQEEEYTRLLAGFMMGFYNISKDPKSRIGKDYKSRIDKLHNTILTVNPDTPLRFGLRSLAKNLMASTFGGLIRNDPMYPKTRLYVLMEKDAEDKIMLKLEVLLDSLSKGRVSVATFRSMPNLTCLKFFENTKKVAAYVRICAALNIIPMRSVIVTDKDSHFYKVIATLNKIFFTFIKKEKEIRKNVRSVKTAPIGLTNVTELEFEKMVRKDEDEEK